MPLLQALHAGTVSTPPRADGSTCSAVTSSEARSWRQYGHTVRIGVCSSSEGIAHSVRSCVTERRGCVQCVVGPHRGRQRFQIRRRRGEHADALVVELPAASCSEPAVCLKRAGAGRLSPTRRGRAQAMLVDPDLQHRQPSNHRGVEDPECPRVSDGPSTRGEEPAVVVRPVRATRCR